MKKPTLKEAAAAALAWMERQPCRHESTHRGGTIWTICDECGWHWADDEGGFVPYAEPKEITDLRDALGRQA